MLNHQNRYLVLLLGAILLFGLTASTAFAGPVKNFV